ncbi:MAG: DUF1772 domain-containing protein [Bryobacterales bacterium]|nr:DUF1772 domain-containing protein [Bryobacterales bacterium]
MPFHVVLLLSTLLCSLVAGFLFAFAVVVMPGIAKLGDREYLRAFQTMDRVIQDNQPLFLLVWVGSVLAVLAAAVLGFRQLAGMDLALMMTAAALYVFGVQLPTIAIHIPLNNAVQRDAISRRDFEPRWNRWNVFRTLCAIFVSALLLVLMLRS